MSSFGLEISQRIDLENAAIVVGGSPRNILETGEGMPRMILETGEGTGNGAAPRGSRFTQGRIQGRKKGKEGVQPTPRFEKN